MTLTFEAVHATVTYLDDGAAVVIDQCTHCGACFSYRWEFPDDETMTERDEIFMLHVVEQHTSTLTDAMVPDTIHSESGEFLLIFPVIPPATLETS